MAVTLSIILAASHASAVPQLTSTTMTCAALKAAVSRAGAAIVRHQSQRMPGVPLYDRYVRSSQFCSGNDVIELDYVPAKDTASCALKKCVPFDFSPDGRM
jgi:hypothetical protein